MTFNMHRRFTIFSAAIIATCLLHSAAGSVQAGYVVASLSGEADLRPGNGAGWSDFEAGAGAARQPAKAPTFERQVSLVRHAQYFNLVGIQSGTGGMTAPSADSGGHFAPLAVLFDPGVANAQLVGWLGLDGRAWLPPPFSSGVFRPPRGMA